jgi:hypothetical protein
MARYGGWLTPRFLGRYGLYKPPLLMWLSGASLKLFGVSRLSLRLPAALATALACALVFWWGAEWRGWTAGLGAAALLATHSLWFTVSHLALTDGLLAASLVLAMYCLYRDPALERQDFLLLFAAAVAAGILVKTVAGLTPLLIASGFWLSGRRPQHRRTAAAVALIAVLSGWWFAWQAVAHPRWFWAEHFGVEVLAFGTGAPPQTTAESSWLFYLRRLLIDPWLAMLFVLAAPGLLAAWKKEHGARLLTIWMAVTAVLLLLWSYRNYAYLLPLAPAMCLASATYFPVPRFRALAIAAAAVAGVTVVGAMPKGQAAPAAGDLSQYCMLRRDAELIVAEPVDDFVAALLPLPRIRYLYRADPERLPERSLDFRQLGVLVSGQEFVTLDRWMPVFHGRLRAMGLDSTEPIATAIFARTSDELREILRARPGSDFFVPVNWAGLAPFPEHEMRAASGRRLFLLARRPIRVEARERIGACHW